jgi:small subunit ribosomal protein S20
VLKTARLAVGAKAAEALEKIKKAVSVIDKAAERGIIHTNKAARLKSRLMQAFNKTR